MKTLITLVLLTISIASNAQLTTSISYEPIGTAIGGKLDFAINTHIGIYTSYTEGRYKLFTGEHIDFNKLSAGITKYCKSEVYLQSGVVYSRWSQFIENTVFTKTVTCEFGFGYTYTKGLNIAVRYNPFKHESTIDIGYKFNL